MLVPDEHEQRGGTRQGLVPVALALLLAVAMTWPLALHVGSDIPKNDIDPDPLFYVWHEAWIGHAVLEQPLDLFQANRFWPEPDSLAFTDVVLGYAPAAVWGAGSIDAALVVYNLLFLFTYALAFLGAYLLAHELGASRLASVVAGAAFAYAPWRLAQDGHLAVISSGGIPLALFLLVRGYRRRSARLVLAGWLVTTWQLTLGFTLGVPLVYVVLAVGVVVSAYWLRRGRPVLGRSVVGASVAGVCLLALVTFFQAQPYFRVLDDHPEAKRTPELVTYYSPPLRGFLAASDDNFLWAGPTARAEDSLRAPTEQTLFPGIAILMLAGFGLFSSAYPVTLRLWIGAGTILSAAVSLGLRDEGHITRGFTPYRLLYELAPGWDGLRTPGRVHTLTTLGLALLAAAGTALLLREIRSRPLLRKPSRNPARREVAALVTAGILTGVILLEGLGPTELQRVPAVPDGFGTPDPQLHLPSGAPTDSLYSLWSIDGFPRIVNGYGAFTPSRLAEVRRITASFPDERSVAFLRELGVRTVILHPELAVGTSFEDAAERSTRGLPLVREDKGRVVLYRLR